MLWQMVLFSRESFLFVFLMPIAFWKISFRTMCHLLGFSDSRELQVAFFQVAEMCFRRFFTKESDSFTLNKTSFYNWGGGGGGGDKRYSGCVRRSRSVYCGFWCQGSILFGISLLCKLLCQEKRFRCLRSQLWILSLDDMCLLVLWIYRGPLFSCSEGGKRQRYNVAML